MLFSCVLYSGKQCGKLALQRCLICEIVGFRSSCNLSIVLLAKSATILLTQSDVPDVFAYSPESPVGPLSPVSPLTPDTPDTPVQWRTKQAVKWSFASTHSAKPG